VSRRYICEGGVRGGCGIQHLTLKGALRCLSEDQEGCASQGGYSDRRIVRADGEDLDAVEASELDALGGAL
jgi:hypothetical protein